MAYPYILESNFEAGTNAEWTSESDTGSKLDIVSYRELVRSPKIPAPFRGAYCMQIVAGDANDHTLTSTSITCADGSSIYTRFYFYVSPNFTATADDVFNLYEFQQAGGTIEGSLGMQITAATNKLEIGIGDGLFPTSFVEFVRGRWTCIETLYTVSTIGAGVFTLYIDGGVAIALTALTNAAAVGKGVLGLQDTLATTTGTLLFDEFVVDDLRVYPLKDRFPDDLLLTKTHHVFVGEGTIENATLLSGAATDNSLTLYDTDSASTLDYGTIKLELKNVVNSDVVDPAGVPIRFKRGCYAVLAGTNPRALLKVGLANGYRSDAAVLNCGLKAT
jgi:hypothetical protein